MTPRSPVSAERMLTVLAYFQHRGPVKISDAAAELSLPETRLRETLGQLWCCGLPGNTPYEMIDLVFSSGPEEAVITDASDPGGDTFDEEYEPATAAYAEVIDSAGLTRPLRLTAEEAIALKAALATLIGRDAVADQAGIAEALEMLTRVTTSPAPLAGAAATPPSASTDMGSSEDHDEAVLLRHALANGRAIRFMYHSARSDSSRIRVVDGGRLQLAGQHTYVRGFDRAAGDWRTFRVDRISNIEDCGPAHEVAPEPELGETMPPSQIWAEVRPGAEWFLDNYPFSQITHSADGKAQPKVLIDYFDPGWLRRFLLSNAALITPCDPELRADISAEAIQALAQYSHQKTNDNAAPN